jgi:ureidoglycolate lyase
MKALAALMAQPITAAAFAPYGWVAQADGHAGRLINGGSSLRVDGVGELSLTAEDGKPCITVFRAQARQPEGPWQELERHRLGTQTFVPLGGVRYVMLVALGDGAPDAATLAAFVVGGQQAVTLRAGTWHHGLIALNDGDFVVIERSAQHTDCDLAQLPAPVALSVALTETAAR